MNPTPAPVAAPAPPEETPAIPTPAPERRRSRPASRLLFESALIVLSVLLGLALGELRERERERALADTALENFRREIRENLATLRRVQPMHAAMAERLEDAADRPSAGGTAFDAFLEHLPEGGLDLRPLRTAAWETAATTGALRLIDYEHAARLSELYLIQRALGTTIERLADRFHDPRNFDPAERAGMLRTHHMLLVELSGQEGFLMEQYDPVLRALGEARP